MITAAPDLMAALRYSIPEWRVAVLPRLCATISSTHYIGSNSVSMTCSSSLSS